MASSFRRGVGQGRSGKGSGRMRATRRSSPRSRIGGRRPEACCPRWPWPDNRGGGAQRRTGEGGRRGAGRRAPVEGGKTCGWVSSGRGRPEEGAPPRAVHGGRRFRRQAQLATAVALAVMAQDARAAQGGVLRRGQARPRDRGGARASRATRAGGVVANLGTALLSLSVCAWMVREKMRHTQRKYQDP